MKNILSIILSVFVGLFFMLPNVLLAGEGVTENTGSATVGANLSDECLMGVGQNCFHYEAMIGLTGSQPGSGYTATSIAQDVVVSATYMVGTILTVVSIYCGLMYIIGSGSGKVDTKYRDGLKNAAIGAILVWGAYAIVRLIQYIARG